VDPTAAPAPVASTPAKPGEPAPASSASTSVGGSGSVGYTPPPQADTGSGSGSKIAAYSAFGVGAVGIGLGTFFILKSASERSKANDICNVPPNNSCPKERKPEVDQLDSDASSHQTIAIVGFAVGGAGIATGILLLALNGGSSAKIAETKPVLQPWVGLGMAGVSGRF
jgi:hypothetical protein